MDELRAFKAANSAILDSTPAKFKETAENKANQLTSQVYRLDYPMTENELKYINNRVKPFRFEADVCTGDATRTVQHPICKAYEYLGRLLVLADGANEIGPDVVGIHADHVCSVKEPHNAYRRNAKSRFPRLCTHRGCSQRFERLAANMVHDISVDEAIDIMQRHGATNFKISMLVDSPNAIVNIDSEICKIHKDPSKDVIVYNFGNEYEYRHRLSGLEQWLNCDYYASKRGYIAECQRTFGMLKIFNIARAPAGETHITNVRKKHAFTYNDHVNVPMPNISTLLATLNSKVVLSDSEIQNLIATTPFMVLPKKDVDKIINYSLARTDKIWCRSNFVQFIRSLSSTAIGLHLDRVEAHIFPHMELFTTVMFCYGSVLRYRSTKRIGYAMTCLNGYSWLSACSDLIRQAFYWYPEMGSRAAAAMSRYLDEALNPSPTFFPPILNEEPDHYGANTCEHGVYIRNHSNYHPVVHNLPRGKVLCNFGIKNVTTEVDHQLYSTIHDSHARLKVDCSVDCPQCRETFDWTLTERELPGNSLFVQGKGYEVINTGVMVAYKQPLSMTKFAGYFWNFNIVTPLAVAASFINCRENVAKACGTELILQKVQLPPPPLCAQGFKILASRVFADLRVSCYNFLSSRIPRLKPLWHDIFRPICDTYKMVRVPSKLSHYAIPAFWLLSISWVCYYQYQYSATFRFHEDRSIRPSSDGSEHDPDEPPPPEEEPEEEDEAGEPEESNSVDGDDSQQDVDNSGDDSARGPMPTTPEGTEPQQQSQPPTPTDGASNQIQDAQTASAPLPTGTTTAVTTISTPSPAMTTTPTTGTPISTGTTTPNNNQDNANNTANQSAPILNVNPNSVVNSTGNTASTNGDGTPLFPGGFSGVINNSTAETMLSMAGLTPVRQQHLPFNPRNLVPKAVQTEGFDCFFASLAVFHPTQDRFQLRARTNKPGRQWGEPSDLVHFPEFTVYIKAGKKWGKTGTGPTLAILEYTYAHYQPLILISQQPMSQARPKQKQGTDGKTAKGGTIKDPNKPKPSIQDGDDSSNQVQTRTQPDGTKGITMSPEVTPINCEDFEYSIKAAAAYLMDDNHGMNVFLFGAKINDPKIKCVEQAELNTLSLSSPVIFYDQVNRNYPHGLSITNKPGVYNDFRTHVAPYDSSRMWLIPKYGVQAYIPKKIKDLQANTGRCDSCFKTRKTLPRFFKLNNDQMKHHKKMIKKMNSVDLGALKRGSGSRTIQNVVEDDLHTYGCSVGKFDWNYSNVKKAQYYGIGWSDPTDPKYIEHQFKREAKNRDEFTPVKIVMDKPRVEAVNTEFIDQALSLKDKNYTQVHSEARRNLVPVRDINSTIFVAHGVAGAAKSTLLREKLGKKAMYVTTTRKLAQEYKDRGFNSCTVSKFFAKWYSKSAKFESIVLDECFLMHAGTILQAILTGKKVYMIGDPYQGEYGSDEYSTKFPVKSLYDQDLVNFRYVSYTVPRDICNILREQMGYPIFTNSTVSASVVRVSKLDITQKMLCFLKETRQHERYDAFTAPQAQGSRMVNAQLFVESNATPLMNNVPSMVLVNLTRHSNKLMVKADCSYFWNTFDTSHYDNYIKMTMKGGALKRVTSEFGRTEYASGWFEGTEPQEMTRRNKVKMIQAATDSLGTKVHVVEQTKLRDDLPPFERKTDYEVETVKIDTFEDPVEVMRTANHVKIAINPNVWNDLDKFRPVGDFVNDPFKLSDYDGQDEKERDPGVTFEQDDFCVTTFDSLMAAVAPTSLNYDSIEEYHYHNSVFATNRGVTLKREEEVMEPRITKVRRLRIPLRGRPYISGDVNQQVHTAITRSRDPEVTLESSQVDKVTEELFETYKRYVRPVQATPDLYNNCAAAYCSRISAKKGPKIDEFYDEDDYTRSNLVSYFPKIQTKKDLKPDSHLRFNGFETKATQSVNPVVKGINTIISPAVRTVEECALRGLDSRLHLHFGKTRDELRQKVTRAFKNDGSVFVTSDYTEFDTFHDKASQNLMHKVFEYHGVDPSVLYLVDRLDKKWVMDGGNIKIEMSGHLKSGQPDTLFKNTIFSMCLNLTYLQFEGLSFAAFVGDDSCLRVRKFHSQTYPEGYWMKTKLETGKVGAFVGYIIYDDLYLDIPRVAAGIANKNYMTIESQLLSAISEYQLGVADMLRVIRSQEHLESTNEVNAVVYDKHPEFIRSLLNIISSYAFCDPNDIAEVLSCDDIESKTIEVNEDLSKEYVARIGKIHRIR
ncbi:replicase [Wenling hepe-like virus 2]|uniref:replicase n=1 Tax=Wenling hepe-like virus 2 TaxID=1923494 RepID=UPI00090A1C69|nr:replicase [Wenling hepe-like virus 2]APG77828.1 replicase [Wenling hepe-like virus 2]